MPLTLPSEDTFPLWPMGEVPGSLGLGEEDIPTLTVYRPSAGTGTGGAVVICPGGGYGHLADHEAGPVALWLNTLGVTGFVLRYRLGPRYRHPAPLADAQRAIRTVRARAAAWDIDAQRVGILGFSAGGHLASTAATHFDTGDPGASDPTEREGSRPDVAILIYPVISLGERSAHLGSRRNLLGETPTPEMIASLSNETQVTPETPPAFLVHSVDDTGVLVDNSLQFALALSASRVPFAMQIYEHGGHGYGLGDTDPVLSAWPRECAAWLRARGFLGTA
ncbi:MAG: alpha/beta hydrolase [Cytophagales bacterium]|nr:alpha/beta hydrolase [Armatimonadota bacterium]